MGMGCMGDLASMILVRHCELEIVGRQSPKHQESQWAACLDCCRGNTSPTSSGNTCSPDFGKLVPVTIGLRQEVATIRQGDAPW